MSSVGIGLMGFGRIGRNLFRILYQSEDIRLRAISDTADHKALEYLLRFDTILGQFPDEVSIKEGHLYVAGRQIPMLSEAEPGDVPWADLGVDVVIEATARKWTREQLERHFERGAKKVILCAPPQDPPDITVVMGVNDNQLKPEHRIVSNGSCTAHCAAPIIKILHGTFGIKRAFLSTVHAYTNQQRLADVPSEDKRRGRAAAENIIPQQTDAAGMVTRLIPEMAGRISGGSMNVPVRRRERCERCQHRVLLRSRPCHRSIPNRPGRSDRAVGSGEGCRRTTPAGVRPRRGRGRRSRPWAFQGARMRTIRLFTHSRKRPCRDSRCPRAARRASEESSGRRW